MLLTITRFSELDARKLMDVYAESNFDNTDCFYPDLADKAEAVRRVEAGFLDYLENDFFTRPECAYWILVDGGVWVSALRTFRTAPGLYELEALETRPDRRRGGCAARLLTGVARELARQGPFRLRDRVGRKNTASLRTHKTCGFRIVSEADERHYVLEYDGRT